MTADKGGEGDENGNGVVAPVVIGACAALGLALVGSALVLGGDPERVAGTAVAQPWTAPTTLPYQGSLGPAAVDAPGVPPTTPGAAPAPHADAVPARPRDQRPGTIRLARGGTATLIRQNVGPGAVLPVPENVHEATWWGARLDASTGATVLAGHVNWRGQTGPFAELWDDGVGAAVSVVDNTGKTWRYRVSRIVTLVKDELPRRAAELFGQDGPHRLVLVTCGGQWVGGEVGYASNLIVIADPLR